MFFHVAWSSLRSQALWRVRGPLQLHSTTVALKIAKVGLAVPEREAEPNDGKVLVSSAHQDYPGSRLHDGQTGTFWVSDGFKPGTGAWIRVSFKDDRTVNAVTVTGRAGHGPKAVEVYTVEPDGTKRRIADGKPGRTESWRAAWEKPQRIRQVEIRMLDAYDSVTGDPRNVQVSEISIEGPGWRWPARTKDSLPNWEQKALYRPLGASAPDTSVLLATEPAAAPAAALQITNAVEVSQFVDAAGKLTWTAPPGRWRIYRFCYTVGPRAHVSTSSQGWTGLALDPMDPEAFQRYWDAVVEPLMRAAKAVGGSALKYLHTDSWEIEPYNWTARFPEAFRARCGYDMRAWFPVLAGRVVDSQEASERFLHDFRKTVAALTAENYFGQFLKNAHRHGVQVRAESGGPHAVPIDAQHCLGMIDAPMSEFWAQSWRHRLGDANRFFVKQPAMAAHTYGRRIVAAEGFTTIGPHWQERVWDNLKPSFDQALCEGLNQLLWTLVTCSPPEMGMPGQEMFPGTHFNPNSTWWQQSEGFLAYINRCQWLLRQGLFVADVIYYYGDHAPNFAQLKSSNPARLPPGFDYDVATEHVVLERLSAKAGRLVLPDGMSYAALVLAPHRTISLPVLRRLRALAEAGGIVIGVRPESSSGLDAWQKGDTEAQQLIAALWGKTGTKDALVKYSTTADWLPLAGTRSTTSQTTTARLPPDFSVVSTNSSSLDYLHRRAGEADIYFVANREGKPARGSARFRVTGKAPELWDPRDGTVRRLPQWRALGDGTTEVPLEFEAFGSLFVVFREAVARTDDHAAAKSPRNFMALAQKVDISGPWRVTFDAAWFYPDDGSGGDLVFATLGDWTQRPEEAVRQFSGAATYHTRFDAPAASLGSGKNMHISLGEVREMARVRINGCDLGVVWCPPWRAAIPNGILTEKDNRLEIEVVNFWPNRLIGDAKLPVGQRRTRTNIVKFDEPNGDPHYTTLMPSGLLGPVSLQASE